MIFSPVSLAYFNVVINALLLVIHLALNSNLYTHLPKEKNSGEKKAAKKSSIRVQKFNLNFEMFELVLCVE